MDKKTNKGYLDIIFPACALSAAISFLIFLYAPLETFFTNKNEFWFDLYGFIFIDLVTFFLAALFLLLIFFGGRSIGIKCYRALFVTAGVLYFGMYIEGTFLSKGLPRLDGSTIDWNSYGIRRLYSLLVLCLLLVIFLLITKKYGFEKTETIIKYGSLILSCILFVTVITLGISNKGFDRKTRTLVSKDNEFLFSTDQNLIILVLDAVDGSHFEKVIGSHPEYMEQFKDFTNYSNMVSTYTQTDYSVPHILTGEWFEYGKEEYADYKNRAYNASQLLEALTDKGYHIGVYETSMLPSIDTCKYKMENIRKTNLKKLDVLHYLISQTRMVGFRYAPFDLKRYCVVYNYDFRARENPDEDAFSAENYDFFEDLNSRSFETTPDKVFKFIHVEGAHVPFRYDEEVNLTEEETDYDTCIAASFTIANRFLERLKELDVYDDSAIIIMSDHGFSTEDIPEDRLHPIFLAKGIDEHKETLQMDDAPVSFEDLKEVYPKLMEGAPGNNIFDWHEGDIRDRRCYVYSYPVVMHNVECIQHGHAGDLSTIEYLE